jgi:hypothetical protein
MKKIQGFCFCDGFVLGATGQAGRVAGLQGWKLHRMGKERVGPSPKELPRPGDAQVSRNSGLGLSD